MYKIGQTIKIENEYLDVKNWPIEETLKPLFENSQLVAQYEVKQVDKEFIYGRVTNTYGHKRRKK